MSTENILTILFSLVMTANIIAFVRHWRMMRVMNIVLNNLVETQKQYAEFMENERRNPPLVPSK